MNNTIYYALFDAAVNRYLLSAGALPLPGAAATAAAAGAPPPGAAVVDGDGAIGVVVDSGCTFFHSLAFPDEVETALRVARVGASSVRYELGVFRAGAREPAAQGHFTHVYVDATTRRPVAALRGRLAEAVLVLQQARGGGSGGAAQ